MVGFLWSPPKCVALAEPEILDNINAMLLLATEETSFLLTGTGTSNYSQPFRGPFPAPVNGQVPTIYRIDRYHLCKYKPPWNDFISAFGICLPWPYGLSS